MKKLFTLLVCIYLTTLYADETYQCISLYSGVGWTTQKAYKELNTSSLNIDENNQFIFGTKGVKYCVTIYANYFNSLSDFEFIYSVGDGYPPSYTRRKSEYSLDNVVAVGSSWHFDTKSTDFILGKPISSLEQLQKSTCIMYEGYLISNPQEKLTAELNTQTGVIQGVFGKLHFEFSDQPLNGVLKAFLYSKNDATTKKGVLFLRLYGDGESLAGGIVHTDYSPVYRDSAQEGSLVYLRKVN